MYHALKECIYSSSQGVCLTEGDPTFCLFSPRTFLSPRPHTCFPKEMLNFLECKTVDLLGLFFCFVFNVFICYGI